MKVAIIGIGRLGRCLIDGLRGLHEVLAVGRSASEYGGTKISADLEGSLGEAEIVIITVKPKDMRGLLDSADFSKKTVLSFAAGLPLEFYAAYSGRISRAMTNIAVSVRKGTSVVTFGRDATAKDREGIAELLGSLGSWREIDETLQDAVVGVSGSAIAYFMKILHIFQEEAERLGLPPGIVLETMDGATALMRQGKAEDLIATVASKGGTTEAGLMRMDELEVPAHLREVIKETIERCRSIRK